MSRKPSTPAAAPVTRLREERVSRGLSIAKVAADVNTDPSNLSRIELGQTPSRDVARALHAYYGGQVGLGDIYDPLYRFEVGGRLRGR